MPQRSTEFQRFIYLLHHQLHDRAAVTESAMVPDRVGGPAQEVDVLIAEPAGQIVMLIAVEVRDRQRPATIEWVQQMRGKHEHRTDKLILVSRSGFTGPAIEEAGRYGIETMSLTVATEADWNVVVNRLKEVFVGKFSFSISGAFVVFADEYGISEEAKIGSAEYLFSSEDEPLGQLGSIGRERLQQPDAAKGLIELFYQHQDRSQATAMLEVPNGTYVVDTEKKKWRIKGIRLEVTCNMKMTPVPLQHGALGSVNVAWGQAAGNGEGLFLTLTEQEHSSGAVLRLVKKGEDAELLVDLQAAQLEAAEK